MSQSNVPSDARDGGYSAKLMDNVARKKINIIIIEGYSCVADALAV